MNYSQVPNKQGGDNNQGGCKWLCIIIIGGLEQSGGLEIVQYNKSEGFKQLREGGGWTN